LEQGLLEGWRRTYLFRELATEDNECEKSEVDNVRTPKYDMTLAVGEGNRGGEQRTIANKSSYSRVRSRLGV